MTVFLLNYDGILTVLGMEAIKVMDKEELQALIKGGETVTTEFKLNAPWQAEMAQRLCGFANSALGGILVLGVEDKSWEIKGVRDTAAAIDEIIKGAAFANPPIPLVEGDPQIVELEGKNVIIARVPPNSGILYQSGGVYWIRRGTMTRPMTTEQVAEYLNRQGLISWERQVHPMATLDHLDMKQVESYLNQLIVTAGKPSRASDTLELLTLLGCVHRQVDQQTGERQLRPTNAGLLLFGYAPRFFFSQAEIVCTYYRDRSGIRRYDDRRIISGTITDQIDQAFSFLKLYTPIGAHIEGFSRIDEPTLPLEALREAVVNAVVHRDYSIEGEAIRIFYYADRIEIHNPGLLMPGLSLEELQKGRSRSKPRNPIIASILRDMPGNYMERVGTGIPFLINQMRSLGLPEPEFHQTGEFVLTFWYNPAEPYTNSARDQVTQSEQPAPKQTLPLPEPILSGSKEERWKLALEHARQHGFITNREYQQVAGVSESTATRDLDALVELGRLKRTGRGPSRRYLL